MLYLDTQHALSGFEGHIGSRRWQLLRTCGGKRFVDPGSQSRNGGELGDVVNGRRRWEAASGFDGCEGPRGLGVRPWMCS